MILSESLASWQGTPFRHFARVKGKGCDCFSFMMGVLEECDMIPLNIKLPEYTVDWHLHRGEEGFINWIKDTLPCKEISMDDPKDGDVYVFRFGRVGSHCGIYFQRNIHHAYYRTGVISTAWNDAQLKRRMITGFRFIT